MKTVRFLELEYLWKRPIISVWLVLFMSATLSISGFWLVEKGSVVDDPIRDRANKYIIAEKEVKNSGINLSNPAYILMRCPHITEEHLMALINFSESFEKFLEKHELNERISILSLANAPDYKKEEDVGGNFITREMLSDSLFNAREWIKNNISRIDVEKGLMGKVSGQDGYEYFIVTILPEQDFPELEMYRLIRTFLKGEDLSFWELYLHPDLVINPDFFKVDGKKINITIERVGWSQYCGEIDVQSNAAIWINLLLGILCLSALFLFLVLREKKQVFISLVIILLAFLVNRCLIGLFDQLSLYLGGFRYLEDVFSILNPVASLIAGFSFPLRCFYRFNQIRSEESGNEDEDYWKIWRKAFKEVFPAISLVVFVAVTDYLIFLGCQHFQGSRSMWQVAVFSATGLMLAYVLTAIFLPPFYKILGGKSSNSCERKSDKIDFLKHWFKEAVEAISGFFLKAALRKPIIPAMVFLTVTVSALVMLSQGRLATDSRPEELLKNLPSWKTFEELKKEGRIGSYHLEIYIKGDLNNPATLDAIQNYLRDIERDRRTKSVFSPMNFFFSVAEEDIGYKAGMSIESAIEGHILEENKDGKVTPEEIKEESCEFVESIWRDILSEKPFIMKHFLARNGEEILVAITFNEPSAAGILDYAEKAYEKSEKYNLLERVEVPSKPPQYAYADKLISQGPFNTNPPWGILLNDSLSIITIFFIVFMVLRRLNTKNEEVKFRSLVAGILVILPFIFSLMVTLLAMMLWNIPYDVASAAIRSITVSVAVDLPIFLLVGFRRIVIQSHERKSEKLLSNPAMKHEANEVFFDYFPASLAFITIVGVAFTTVSRTGVLMEISLFSFYLATMTMVLPGLKYVIKK